MEQIFGGSGVVVLRFDAGEEVIAGLQEFCRNSGVGGADIAAIGAAREVLLSWYDVDAQRYTDRTIAEKLEIASLMGTVAEKGDEIIVHTHGVFSFASMETVGGHVKRLVVGATCEVILRPLPSALRRAYVESVGLNLLTGAA